MLVGSKPDIMTPPPPQESMSGSGMSRRGGASSTPTARQSNTPWWEGWEAFGSTLVIPGIQQSPSPGRR